MARGWWRRLLSVPVALALLGPGAAAVTGVASPAALAAGPMGINGLDVNGTTGALPTQSSIDALAAGGAGWIRLEFNTGPFGGTDSAAFYQAYDQLVNMYRNDGIQILGLVDYETEPGSQSDWTANNQENTGGNGDNNYIVGLGAIAARIANHYQSQITYYEVWNEPNCWSSNPSPGVFTGCTYIYPSNFAAMLTEVYAQSKIYNHYNVQFVSGGLFGHSIGNVYNCGNAGGTYLSDTYNEGVNITGKFTWAKNNDGGNYPLDAVGQHIYITQGGSVTTAQIQQYLGCIRSAYTAYDSGNKKIWITEFGWNTASVSQATQGANIDTAFNTFQTTSYVQTATLFTVADFGSSNQWGIWYGGCDISQVSCRKSSYNNFVGDVNYQGEFSNKSVDQGILNLYNSRGGEAFFGSPFDNGGGPWVHSWTPGNVQDTQGGSDGPAILADGPGGTYFVDQGFRSTYLASGTGQCVNLLDNAYASGSGTRQDFSQCYMSWDPTNGVVVHEYAPDYYNNPGVSDDSNPGGANFDGGHYSYSLQALAAAGLKQGAAFSAGGLGFQWPAPGAGANDNVQAAGQVIALTPQASAAGTLGLLGAATNGATSGTATIHYTDGSTQQFTLGFTDWAKGTSPQFGNTVVATMPYRNGSSGKQSINVYVYLATVALLAGKTADSITLPSSVSGGQLHVFAVSYGLPNNIGISADSATSAATFDTTGNSYSQQALNADGYAPGVTVTVNGQSFTWPLEAPGQPDNVQAAGQTISVSGSGTLGILGSATNGPSSGTATIHYSDGSTQQFTLGLSDWTLNGGTAQPSFGNIKAATMSYRNTPSGQQTVSTYVFYTSVALIAGKTVTGLTLPSSVSQGQVHVFAVTAS